MTKRTLILRKETLAALTADELAGLATGAPTFEGDCQSVPLSRCFTNEGPFNCIEGPRSLAACSYQICV